MLDLDTFIIESRKSRIGETLLLSVGRRTAEYVAGPGITRGIGYIDAENGRWHAID
jgi:hypothetical protein